MSAAFKRFLRAEATGLEFNEVFGDNPQRVIRELAEGDKTPVLGHGFDPAVAGFLLGQLAGKSPCFRRQIRSAMTGIAAGCYTIPTEGEQ